MITPKKNMISSHLPKMKNSKLLLIGTGSMALGYAKVLKTLGLKFSVVGRGKSSALKFKKETGITPVTGGIAKFLATSDYSSYLAIVAVNGDQLAIVCGDLIKHGLKSILLEKPGGLDNQEIKKLSILASKKSAKIYIAYNRRFYASVKKAQEIIKKDGGVLSFQFEFNELSDMISKLDLPQTIKNNWLLHNSSHLMDLAFFIAGKPTSLIAYTQGSLKWHPKAAIFTGIGISGTNKPFSYHANWLSPGRWSIEFMTSNYRLIFKPLEKLQMQKKGSFEINNLDLDDKLDTQFKPGLYKQVESFLTNKKSLCSIEEQVENIQWYSKILNGT